MKTAEILRKLADLVDTVDGDATESENIGDNTGVMVPPLQQKIELEKKEAGVDNLYDQEQAPTEEQTDDEVTVLQKNAGIPRSVIPRE